MQICALDSNNILTLADRAVKQQNYFCVECQQVVRLRSGIHRQAHFFHIQPNRTCGLHAKGMPHLMLQSFLHGILPAGEAELECRFPSIKRIADVAWHHQKIIFEIQCSPISAEEVAGRNRNYASLGYRVVWILHDNRYNQARLSAAEEFLMSHSHYFTNMNADGEGIIYDQFAAVTHGKRVFRLPALSIDPSSPKLLTQSSFRSKNNLPFILNQRAKTWPLMFTGDLLDTVFNHKGAHDHLDERQKELFLKLELFLGKKSYFLQFLTQKNILKEYVVRPYQAVLKLMIEKACR
jgi:competence protein CoiA